MGVPAMITPRSWCSIPFLQFGLFVDCINRSENPMTHERVFLAAELALSTETLAEGQ